jgi:hypothetical protein
MADNKYYLYSVCAKTVIFSFLFLVCAAVPVQDALSQTGMNSQQSPDDASSPVTEDGTKDGNEEDYVEPFPTESEFEQYNIYRKENPYNPCDRGQDAYDYEKQ